MNKSDIIMIGASGHAKVAIELLQSSSHNIAYCIDQPESELQHCLDIEVLHGDHHLSRLRAMGYRKAFVAIGNNQLRLSVANKVAQLGYELVNAISSQANISPSARLGKGVAVMAGCVINAQAVIGDLAIVNTGATIDHDCHIGKATHVGPQCGLAGNVYVDDQVFLGLGTKVIPGIKIGGKTVSGAGSVIISDLPANVLVVGGPARIIREFGVEKH